MVLGVLGDPVWGRGFRSTLWLAVDLCFFESVCKVQGRHRCWQTPLDPVKQGLGALGRQSVSRGMPVGWLFLNN